MATANRKPRTRDDFDWEDERVSALLEFLERNAAWNREFQVREYARALSGCASDRDRLITFLHWNVSTQSEADIDDLMSFWRLVHAASVEQTSTLSAFAEYLAGSTAALSGKIHVVRTERPTAGDSWGALFAALNSHRGWGLKTTALFVKAAIKLHRGARALHFWPDATPDRTALRSKPFLPVDRVILHVFRTLGHPCPREDNINRGLRGQFTAEQMLTWDDLWFWGFFTQAGSGSARELGWNSGKFWSQLSSSKDDEERLKLLGEEFVQLLKRPKS